MKITTSKEISEVDRITIESYGMSSSVLMERAGVSLSDFIMKTSAPERATVICGPGNNGGDGLVCARQMHNIGVKTKAIIASYIGKISKECRVQYEIAKKSGVKISFAKSIGFEDMHGAVLVDALLGTGISRQVEGSMARIIRTINSSGKTVFSVDIPSGISADTGQVLGEAVMADYTVTFGAPKRGHYLHPGAGMCGTLTVADIGHPRALFDGIKCVLPDKEWMSGIIPLRHAYSHKGDYGHVLLIAGSKGKPGAALMAGRACMEAGAGLVTICAPVSIANAIESGITEQMFMPLKDNGQGTLSYHSIQNINAFITSHADVLAVGPAIGVNSDTRRLLRELVLTSALPMVLDADAIRCLEGEGGIFRKAKSPVVLTPHPGEFASISGMSIKDIEADRIGAASAYSIQTGTYLVLKGAPTVIAEPSGMTFINPTGNAGMAKAGSGDVLTGIIAAFLGQGLNPLDASLLGAYMHGLSGDLALRTKDIRSINASDIINNISGAFLSLKA